MRIIVPVTSTNVEPGLDPVGVAVSKYLTIEISESSEKWEVLYDLGDVPSDKTNLLITTALQVKADLQPHRIKTVSDIPLVRGSGSSSPVTVAGVELANQLAHLQLSVDEKLVIVTEIEGYLSNVAPTIFGNLIISSYIDEKINSAVVISPEVSFVTFIPNYELKTSGSRNVLPNEFSYREAVTASSIANVATAVLLTGDLEKAGKAVEADLFHERFRQKLVKEFASIKEVAHEVGAYATCLSGVGPTIMTLTPKAREAEFVERLEAFVSDGEVVAPYADTKGVLVEKD